jgi:hypothetical protein
MDNSRMSDDEYVPMDTETMDKKSSTGHKVGVCFKKFLLAIIAAGLIALLVFQIIWMSAGAEIKAVAPPVTITPAE